MIRDSLTDMLARTIPRQLFWAASGKRVEPSELIVGKTYLFDPENDTIVEADAP